MASTTCFIIVSRNDSPVYEAEVGAAPKKKVPHINTSSYYMLLWI